MSDDGTQPGSLDADMRRLVSESRAEAATHERARERVLRQQATEEATFVGILLDLAEQGCEVSVRTVTGRATVGTITAIGFDFVALRTPAGSQTLIPLAALALVRRPPSTWSPDSAGDRPTRSQLSLAAHLRTLAPERPRVGIAVIGQGQLVSGELRAVGRDVLTMVLDGNPAVTTYLSLSSLAEVSVLASG